jgi:4-amino-4-deoxy-L-arabinose transferase-like glycosyltransferase
MPDKKYFKYYILIIIVASLLFIPNLGNVHLFDWDEINFAEAAREMIVTGDYLTVRIDYQPFSEKPPLFIWLQAISMNIFGVNEFAARLPNALIGIVSLLFIFNISRKIFDEKFGMIWVVTYLGSILPHFYFKSGIIDPLFNLFIFAGVYFLYRHFSDNANFSNSRKIDRTLVLSGLMISLAVLTKGPVGLLLPGLCVLAFWFLGRKKLKFPLLKLIVFSILSMIPFLVWKIVVILNTADHQSLSDFILYQIRLLTTADAGHGGPFYYHFVILMIGCFPASIFALRAFRTQQEDDFKQSSFKLWNIILLSVVLIVFSIVETKIVHYSSLAYFPITFLGAYFAYSLIYRNNTWKSSSNWLIGIFGLIIASLFIIIPFVFKNVSSVLPYIKDKLTLELLKTNVYWSGYESLVGVAFLLILIDSVIHFFRKEFLKGYLVLFFGTAITLFLFMTIFVPKIEPYTQGATVEFYEKLSTQNVYFDAVGYKSYAPYFYGKMKLENSDLTIQRKFHQNRSDWLLKGVIDKPAYFSAKITSVDGIKRDYPDLIELYRKNGFVFFIRMPQK